MKLELDDGRFDSIAFFFRSVCSEVVAQLSSPINWVIIEVKNFCANLVEKFEKVTERSAQLG